MSKAMDFVIQHEPDAQPLYPPAAVCIGVRTFFKNSERGFLSGTKQRVPVTRIFTDARSRVLSATFWREGEGCSWEEAHRLAWEDAAEKVRVGLGR
jgi:hypothetical protein